MTSKERAALRAQANGLEPLFQIGKGGISDALVEQIPGEEPVQIGGGEPGLFQCQLQSLLLHGGLRLFPGFFSKKSIIRNQIKKCLCLSFV